MVSAYIFSPLRILKKKWLHLKSGMEHPKTEWKKIGFKHKMEFTEYYFFKLFSTKMWNFN